MKNLQGKETLATSAYITLILVSRASLMALAIRDNAIAESSDPYVRIRDFEQYRNRSSKIGCDGHADAR